MASNGNNDSPVKVGDIRFYEAIVPALDDGDYTLTASQTLTGLPGADPTQTIPEQTVQFSVRGPRFRLNPADVFSVFPPPGPATPYEGQVAHVVVSRKTLPWERLLAPDQPRTMPWVGLLTIDEADGEIPRVQSGTVADLLEDGDRPAHVTGPALTKTDLDNGELETDPVKFIDIPLELFKTIAPALDDLPLLAHAREVNTGNKPIEGILADGFYSVLIGNRVAHASAMNAAFVVSFEGFEALLKGQFAAGIDTVRIAVLTSWLFQMGGADPFDVVMSAERADLLAIDPPPKVATTLNADECSRQEITVSPPSDPSAPNFAEDLVRYAQQSGYVAVTHALRQGGQTFSWYRGPLIPRELALALDQPPQYPVFAAADALLNYDRRTGLFDTSYAAAFQLGRLVALQNEGFVQALRAYFHRVQAVAFRMEAGHVLSAASHPTLPVVRGADALPEHNAVLHATVRWLTGRGSTFFGARRRGGEGTTP